MRTISSDVGEFLDAKTFFYVFCHASPDGDCVGSSLAFAAFLRKIGRNCEIATDSKKEFALLQAKIEFCAGSSFEGIPVTDRPDFNLICSGKASCVFLDCFGIERTGGIYALAKGDEGLLKKIREESLVIDHHASSIGAGKCRYVDSDASSASELVLEVIGSRIGLEDRLICTALFFGIASDTGFFRFSSASNGAGTFRSCAKLIDAGAPPNIVGAVLDGGKDADYMDYFLTLAKSAEFLCSGKAVLIVDDESLYRKYSKVKRPSDDLYRLFMKISGVEAVFFVKISDTDGFVDGSVRGAAL
ncbi:MAG TPA: hypothetical protein DCO86_00685, partial [Spirochaetaceae bacterium]|nr:hypothetical protein [Spirochaetaceae bacterium]